MHTDMDEKTYAEYKEAFGLFDRDGDGIIARDDFEATISNLGYNPAIYEIDSVLGKDKASLTLEDFILLFSQSAKPQEIDKDLLLDAFLVFDADGSGYVDAKELKHLLEDVGEKLSPAEVDEFLRDAKPDSNGKINYRAMIDAMCCKDGL